MAWLIALGCLALLAGSISMLRPSPRERRQARLRQDAQAAGLRVRMQRLQVPGEPEPTQFAAYVLPRTEAQVRAFRARPTGCVIVRAPHGGLDAIDDNWQFLESDPGARALAADLAMLVGELDGEIRALLSTPGSVGVCWAERGERVTVPALRALLETFAALTSH